MRFMAVLGLVVASAGSVLAPAVALGADLTLTCSGQTIDAGGSRHDSSRRIEIAFGARRANFYEEKVDGYKLVDSYGFVSADSRRINLANDDETVAYIDRMSGEYYHLTKRSGTVVREVCKKLVKSPEPLF
jgi:hypothetical protein